jgi:AraC family ethanolamine operon transcriptional activator
MELAQRLSIASVDELNDFSLNLGWDIIYSQLGPIQRDGGYTELVGQSLIATRESLPAALSIKTGGFPGHIALAQYVSTAPASLNGMEMEVNKLFMASPGADIELVSKGPGDLQIALIPESAVETKLGDSYSAMKKLTEKQQVYCSNANGQSRFFQNWFGNSSTDSPYQVAAASKGREHVLDEIISHSLNDMMEPENRFTRHRKGFERSEPGIARLIDFFHANPRSNISTDQMIKISGQRRRNLFYNFKRYTGFSPRQFFNRVRLSCCHKEILAGGKSITVVALDFNFYHLGEFSAIYKSIYGELPSESRRKDYSTA